LWFIEDIQGLSAQLSGTGGGTVSSKVLIPGEGLDETNTSVLSSLHSTGVVDASRLPKYIGMKADDWKLLLIAASKSGHWKICANTLQFLQPYLQDLHPDNEDETNASRLSRKYRRMTRALTAATLCFEMRSQYAWAIRAIDDWITWSGRRPQKEAVAAAIHSLANRGRGTEVSSLLSRVLQVPVASDDEITTETVPSYEEVLYISAITSLHNNGLYDEADDLYMTAIQNGNLPYSIYREEDTELVTLDLHGMNVALAHSAVKS
jgi:hypothetical protein